MPANMVADFFFITARILFTEDVAVTSEVEDEEEEEEEQEEEEEEQEEEEEDEEEDALFVRELNGDMGLGSCNSFT